MNGITADTKEGETFSSPAYTLSIERLLAFSGGPIGAPDWPAKNLHTDMAKAKDAGLSAPIASGVQYEGYLIRLLTDAFGEAWFTGGSLNVKYPQAGSGGREGSCLVSGGREGTGQEGRPVQARRLVREPGWREGAGGHRRLHAARGDGRRRLGAILERGHGWLVA